MTNRLYPPLPDPLSPDEAMAFVRPFAGPLAEAVAAGLERYGKIDGVVRNDVMDFAEGGVIYSLIAKSLERVLRDVAGIRYELHHNSVRIFVGADDAVVMRIAKTSWERIVGRVSNESEKLRDAYYNLRHVNGLEMRSFRLTLGYVPNTVSWEPASVFVSRQVGREVVWYEELLSRRTDADETNGSKGENVPLSELDLRAKDDAQRQPQDEASKSESQESDER